MSRRWLYPCLLLGSLVSGASACVGGGEDELNPQPLPPNTEEAKGPEQGGTGAVGSGGSSSGASGGSPNPPPADDADAGAEEDAGDGG